MSQRACAATDLEKANEVCIREGEVFMMDKIFTYLGYAAAISGLVASVLALYRQLEAFFKHRFTWRSVEKGVHKLVADMTRDNYHPDLVVGIGRSGGIIGGLIAGYLGAKPFIAVNCDLKEIEEAGAFRRIPVFDSEFSIAPKYKNILLVEGATTAGDIPREAIALMKQKFPQRDFPNMDFRFAVLVKQLTSTAPIKYCAYEVKDIKKLPWHVPEWPSFLTHPTARKSEGIQ